MEKNDSVMKIHCTLAKITTSRGGGYSLTFSVPESDNQAVRELIGEEDRQVFIMVLAKDNT
jgi:hypothetical protein